VENRQNPQKPVYYMSTGIISEHALWQVEEMNHNSYYSPSSFTAMILPAFLLLYPYSIILIAGSLQSFVQT
jgi:hypothetical protein